MANPNGSDYFRRGEPFRNIAGPTPMGLDYYRRGEPPQALTSATSVLTAVSFAAGATLTGALTDTATHLATEAATSALTAAQTKFTTRPLTEAAASTLTPAQSKIATHLRAEAGSISLTAAQTNITEHFTPLAASLVLGAAESLLFIEYVTIARELLPHVGIFRDPKDRGTYRRHFMRVPSSPIPPALFTIAMSVIGQVANPQSFDYFRRGEPVRGLQNKSPGGFDYFRRGELLSFFSAPTFNVNLNPNMVATKKVPTPEPLNANLVLTPAQIRKLSLFKTMAVTSTFTPAEILISKRLLTITGTMTLTAADVLMAKHLRTLAGTTTLTPADVLIAKYFRSLAATATLTGAISQFHKFGRILSYTMNDVVAMTKLSGQFITLAAAAPLTTAWQRQIAMALGRSVSLTPALTNPMTAYRAFNASASLTAALVKAKTGFVGLNTTSLFNAVLGRALVESLPLSFTMLQVMEVDTQSEIFFDLPIIVAGTQQKKVYKSVTTNLVITPGLFRPSFMRMTFNGNFINFVNIDLHKFNQQNPIYNLHIGAFLFNVPTLFSRRPLAYIKLSSATTERPKLVRAKAR